MIEALYGDLPESNQIVLRANFGIVTSPHGHPQQVHNTDTGVNVQAMERPPAATWAVLFNYIWLIPRVFAWWLLDRLGVKAAALFYGDEKAERLR